MYDADEQFVLSGDRDASVTFEPGDQEQGDLLLLAALRRDGIALDRDQDVAAFLDMTTLDGARAAARELKCAGWETHVTVSRDERTWMVRAERRIPPSWANVSSMRETMDAVATRHEGFYDGWGVSAL